MYHLDREIAEQPISVKNSFSNIMDDQEKVKSLFNERRNTFVIGSGSSYHSGTLPYGSCR